MLLKEFDKNIVPALLCNLFKILRIKELTGEKNKFFLKIFKIDYLVDIF